MKTLKLALVATLVAFAMVSVANTDGIKEKPRFSVKIAMTIEQAMQSPGLVAAIYNQVSPEDIFNCGLPPYIFNVKYNGRLYVIGGTYGQWLRFFRIKGIMPAVKKEVKVIID